jgi:hypothetical protein
MAPEKIQSKPVRTCQTMHYCAICEGSIGWGQKYYDGGYGNRGHVSCVDNAVKAAAETEAER